MASQSPKGTVLVIDDEKGVLNLVSAILTMDGYEVLVAESGYSGYSLLEKRFQTLGSIKVDLIITDWVMQGWDGLKLMSQIRARNFGDVAIILMSGAVTREQLEVAAKNKADGILVKPLVKDVLVAKVNDVLSRRKPSST